MGGRLAYYRVLCLDVEDRGHARIARIARRAENLGGIEKLVGGCGTGKVLVIAEVYGGDGSGKTVYVLGKPSRTEHMVAGDLALPVEPEAVVETGAGERLVGLPGNVIIQVDHETEKRIRWDEIAALWVLLNGRGKKCPLHGIKYEPTSSYIKVAVHGPALQVLDEALFHEDAELIGASMEIVECYKPGTMIVYGSNGRERAYAYPLYGIIMYARHSEDTYIDYHTLEPYKAIYMATVLPLTSKCENTVIQQV